jgi:putative membrane protein
MRHQARRRGAIVPPDPRSVGEEPDYRFTLANERTFLAWIRTALALAAGGLGALHLIPDVYGSALLGITLLGLSLATAATSYRRWALNEISMRLGRPLPVSRLPQVMAVATTVVALTAAVLFVVDKL